MIDTKVLERRLSLQIQKQWDIFHDVPWARGVDLDKHLLPIEKDFPLLDSNDNEEKTSLSWMMGLLSASAISSHEKVLNDLRATCWENDLKRANSPKEMFDLGDQFFREEMKHSEAYGKFIDIAAIFLNVTTTEIKSFLPTYNKDSILARLHKWESKLGGNAIWWTVATTEEESIELFRMLDHSDDAIDPLFYEINKLHFEEEVRHSSYSYLMLELNVSWFSKLLRKTSYLSSRFFQSIWIYQQLIRLRGVKQYRDRHPYLEKMAAYIEKVDQVPGLVKFNTIFKNTKYISMMMNPRKHVRIARQIKKNGALSFPKSLGVG